MGTAAGVAIHAVAVQSRAGSGMTHRPSDISAFEFVVLAALRATQLMRGCIPRVEGAHKVITIAQLEIASGKVVRTLDAVPVPVE